MLLAQVSDDPYPTFDQLGQVLTDAFQSLLFVGLGLALVFVIIAGIKWTMAQGDPKALQSARGTLFWAIIGAIICVAIFTLLKMVMGWFGYEINYPIIYEIKLW